MTDNEAQHVQPTRAAAVCTVVSLTRKHQFWFLVLVAWEVEEGQANIGLQGE